MILVSQKKAFFVHSLIFNYFSFVMSDNLINHHERDIICRLKTKLSGLTAHRGPRPTVPISVFLTLGSGVQEQIFRSGGQPNAEPPPVFSSQACLVLIYRSAEGMKG